MLGVILILAAVVLLTVGAVVGYLLGCEDGKAEAYASVDAWHRHRS
jgi:hypothetical protein